MFRQAEGKESKSKAGVPNSGAIGQLNKFTEVFG